MKLPGLRPRPILLLAIGGLAALTCDDGQPAVSLAEQIGQGFCTHQFACCAPIEITALATDRYTTEEDCVVFATLAAREQLGTVDGAIAQGRITIDPARASACVAAYRDRACSGPQSFTQDLSPLPRVADVLALCPDLLVGHVPDGAACDLPQECLRGSRCVGGTPPVVSPGATGVGGMTGTSLTRNPGVCVRYQQLGEPCNTSADCDPALACRTPEFACLPRPREGEPCTVQFDQTGAESDDCAPTGHLFCDNAGGSVCRHYPRENEPCAQFKFPPCDPDPALALSCISFSNECKRPGNEGDPCGGLALPPCRADLACHPTQSDGIGTCGSLPAAGAGCTDRCVSPALCLGGTCTIPGAATIGTPCVVFTDCDSLLCTGFMSGTQVCAQPALTPVCVGAAVSPGIPVNISGVGGIGGTVGTGAAGGSVMGAGGRAGSPPTGTAGAGGVGGTGIPPLGCQASDLPIGDPLIADFTADDMGLLLIGGTFSYPSGPAGGPTAVISDGAWHITATTTGTDFAQYWGVGIYFDGNARGTDCVDATAHIGVQFDISGSIDGPGCTAQYATSDSAHTSNLNDPKGSGDDFAYAPQADLTVTSTPSTVMVPFVGPGAPTGGSPAIAIDKSKLTSVQWQFTTAPGTGNSCVVDITIDNVMFF